MDPSPTRPPKPTWLKAVPTIVIKGEPTPRVGSDVMNWLYERKMKENVGGQREAAAPAAGVGGEPDAWNTIEQGAFSRGGFSYSGLDVDTSVQGEGGTTMPGAFAFLRGASAEGSQGTLNSPMGNGNTKKSKKEELFDKQMEAYQRERDSGMPRFAQRM